MQRDSRSRTIGLVVSHFVCLWLVRLIFLTIITYVFVHSNDVLPKIGNMIRANQMIAYGISALLLSGLLQMLHPLTHTKWKEIFDLHDWHAYLPKHFLRGFILSCVLILGGLFSGHMTWLGVYIKLDEAVFWLISVIIFSFSFLVLMIFEEFILRHALEKRFRPYFGRTIPLIASTVIFISFKLFEFDVTWFEIINFALFNLILSQIARHESTHMASAIFISGFFITSHILFGLPFLGQDMPGVCLVRSSNDQGFSSILSGGSQGPEASLVFTILLLTYIFFQKANQIQRARHQN